jgi:hypothetical protein
MNAAHKILYVFLAALTVALFWNPVAMQAGQNCSDPLLCYHGGEVLQSTQTIAVFWGPEWTNPMFAGDKISGMDTFYAGFGGSHLASLPTEYSSPEHPISANSMYLGHIIDSMAPPSSPPTTAQLLTEACRITNNQPPANGVVVFFTSNMPQSFPYCGQIAFGNCGQGAKAKPILVDYIPNLDGVDHCKAPDVYTNHSDGLAAIANIAAAGLITLTTNPQRSGWHDSVGNGIANKCTHVFPNSAQILSNGSQWYTSAQWSNTAYRAGTGLLSLDGYPACVY